MLAQPRSTPMRLRVQQARGISQCVLGYSREAQENQMER